MSRLAESARWAAQGEAGCIGPYGVGASSPYEAAKKPPRDRQEAAAMATQTHSLTGSGLARPGAARSLSQQEAELESAFQNRAKKEKRTGLIARLALRCPRLMQPRGVILEPLM